MLACLRAELLILRKSRVAWLLVLTAPLLTLVTTYLFSFLGYLGDDNPAMYYLNGTPAQDLPAVLPSQFVIQAAGQLYFTAPFIVLGAVIAGGDWVRGTIRTSMLAGPAGPGRSPGRRRPSSSPARSAWRHASPWPPWPAWRSAGTRAPRHPARPVTAPSRPDP